MRLPVFAVLSLLVMSCGGDRAKKIDEATTGLVAVDGGVKMKQVRIHAIVRGQVQGVGFRASTEDEAARLGLVGWVRNLPDGTVELEAEGPKDRVDALVAWCHHGPSTARVTAVDVEPRDPLGTEQSFDLRY
jgi:acylphosphatase